MSEEIKSFQELRETDPQQAIEYVLGRKAYWKKAAFESQRLLSQNKKKYQTLRKKYMKEQEVKNYWKFAAITVGIGSAVMVTFVLCLMLVISKPSQEYRIPTSGKFVETPNSVLSSVNIFNQNTQGSGIVISKGEKYALILTAAHNFEGNIGRKFWIYYADGSYAEAELLAHDAKSDLALARVPADTVLANSYIPEKIEPIQSVTNVGYTNARGPLLATLRYLGLSKEKDLTLWRFTAPKGTILGGSSGSGIWKDDGVIGVVLDRSSQSYTKNGQWMQDSFVVPHDTIVSFLNANKKATEGCGDWSSVPEKTVAGDAPPMWVPTPNVPVNKQDMRLASLQKEVDELKAKMTAPPLTRKLSEVK